MASHLRAKKELWQKKKKKSEVKDIVSLMSVVICHIFGSFYLYVFLLYSY